MNMDTSSADEFLNMSLPVLFLTIVIFVPLIETVIFHSLPLWIYVKIKNKFKLSITCDFVIGGILGLIFGILHGISYASFFKFFNFVIVGSLYSYAYFRYRRLSKKGWFGIWKIHALNNFVAVLLLAVAMMA